MLADADPMHRGVAVPVEHWKIICYAVDGTLRARAFLFAQQVDAQVRLEEAWGSARRYLVDLLATATDTRRSTSSS